jgi:hypothetical protein
MPQQQNTPDVLISGLSHIEILAGNLARFVTFVERMDPDTRQVYREYPPAIVMPMEALPDAIQKAMAASAVHVAGQVSKMLPRWLH